MGAHSSPSGPSDKERWRMQMMPTTKSCLPRSSSSSSSSSSPSPSDRSTFQPPGPAAVVTPAPAAPPPVPRFIQLPPGVHPPRPILAPRLQVAALARTVPPPPFRPSARVGGHPHDLSLLPRGALLGQGGFGRVYATRADLGDGRGPHPMALKVVAHPAAAAAGASLTPDEDARLFTEATLHHLCSDCELVVTLHAYQGPSAPGGAHYFLMDAGGPSLRDVLLTRLQARRRMTRLSGGGGGGGGNSGDSGGGVAAVPPALCPRQLRPGPASCSAAWGCTA